MMAHIINANGVVEICDLEAEETGDVKIPSVSPSEKKFKYLANMIKA